MVYFLSFMSIVPIAFLLYLALTFHNAEGHAYVIILKEIDEPNNLSSMYFNYYRVVNKRRLFLSKTMLYLDEEIDQPYAEIIAIEDTSFELGASFKLNFRFTTNFDYESIMFYNNRYYLVRNRIVFDWK